MMTEETQAPSTLAKVLDAINEDDFATVGQVINEMPPAEIARTIESLPPAKRETVWEVIKTDFHGNVLAHLGSAALEDLVENLSHETLVQSAEMMDDDDLVDFLHDLPGNTAISLLQSLDLAQRQRLSKLLEYDDDCAGGMMDSETITIRQNVSIDAVLRYLRMLDDLPLATSKLFVVDRSSRLHGEVSLAKLLTADKKLHIADIMNTDSQVFKATDSSQTVTQQFREYDLVSAAVVNEDNQLVGRITVDDVIDVIQEEAERSLMNTAGLDEEVDTFAPIKKATISRGVWLGVNLITALLAASVINAFGATIEKVVALAALSPLVASMGGIAGSQSLTIIIRGIALGQIEGANARLLLMRELIIGILNGIFWGGITAIIALMWFGKPMLSLIVISAIFANLCFAALSGVLIPLTLKKLNIDPALAGSVILTTVTDVVGFLVLLSLAALLL